jgi:hypothetical protein
LITLSCTTSQQGDASISMQDRRTFEENKYRDPAMGTIPENVRTHELAFARTLPTTITASKEGPLHQALDAFRQVGPYNIGGRTRAMAMDVKDPNLLLAGGVSGGLWRSTNGGGSWKLVTRPDDLHSVTAIVQDVREGKTHVWYYTAGEAHGNSAQISGNGVWKSTDNGLTWNVLPATTSDRVPAGHAFAYTWRIVTDPIQNRDIVLVATARGGIHRSTDGGQSWNTVFSSDSYFTDIVVTPDGYYYAALSAFNGFSGQTASRYGIYRSVDGVNWVNISPPDLPTSTRRIVLALVPGDERLFALAETPNHGTRGVFRLRTGERSEWHSLWMYDYEGGDGTSGRWEDRSANIPLFGGRNGDFFSQTGYDLTIRVSPHDTNLVVIGGTNTYRSTNAFRSSDNLAWIGGYGLPNPIDRFPRWPNHHPDQHDVIFHPTDPRRAFNANDGGLMVTDDVYADTVKWSDLSRGYYTTQFYAIAIKDTAGDEHVLGGMQDNGTWEGQTLNEDDPWIVRNGGDGGYCQYAAMGTNMYVSTQQGRIRRVVLDNDGNEVGRTRVDPASVSPSDYIFISPFVVDHNDERIMYHAAGTMLWRNNDLTSIPMGSDDSTDVNWDSLPQTRAGNSNITAVACSRQPAHVVYYGTQGGKIYRLDSANVGMPTPKDISKGLTSGYINNITVDPRNADHVLTTFSNYGVISIYESFDGGTSWSAISGNLEQRRDGSGYGPAVNWVDILPYNDTTDILVAATSTGMYFTPQRNGMSTVWTALASDVIGNVPVDMVIARHSDKNIFVGTHGRGVFIGQISSLPPTTAAPTLVSPPNESRGIYPDTVLVWHAVAGAVSYEVQLSTTPDFSSDVTVIDGITDTSAVVRGLLPGYRTYFWRVSAFAGGGRSEPSTAWTFRTVIEAPTTIVPVDRAEGVGGLPVILEWSRVVGATGYDVVLSKNLAFSVIDAEYQDVQDTTVDVSLLASATRYFWRVRSRDTDTFGLWSPRTQFTTGVLTTVLDEPSSTLTVRPHPASQRISIQAGDMCIERLRLVDVKGRVARDITVVDEQVRTIEVDVSDLAPGTYTLIASCGSTDRTNPVVIAR